MTATHSTSPMLLDTETNRRTVDGVRGIGILLVIFFHILFATSFALEPPQMIDFIGRFPELLNFGWQALGSEIIFLMSGFLIAYLLLREHKRHGRIDLYAYTVKRVSRIVPLYLVGLLFYSFTAKFTALDLLLNLLFISKLFGARTIIPVGWSLELIVQIYLLLPFLVMALVRVKRPKTLLAGIIALSLITRMVALALDPTSTTTPFFALWLGEDPNETQRTLYYLLPYRATPFLVGLALAYVAIEHRDGLQTFATRFLPLVVLISTGLFLFSAFLPLHDGASALYTRERPQFWLGYWTLQRPLLTVAVSLALMLAWYSRGWIGRFVSAFLAARIWGIYSQNIYSVYMFHPIPLFPSAALVFWTVELGDVAFIRTWQILAVFFLTAAGAGALSLLTTRFIELPAQAVIRRRFLPTAR